MTRGQGIALVVAAVVAAVLVATLASRLFSGGSGAPQGPAAAPKPEAPAAAAPPPAAALATGSVPAIEPGDTLELSAAAFEAGQPVVVRLNLPEPSADDEPRPVRVIGPDGGVLETVGALDAGDRKSARVEIESAFLKPGRYVVEMKTTERTHFPLRRYALEVR